MQPHILISGSLQLGTELLHCLDVTEITAFSDRYEEFSKLNTEVLGVSVDSVVSVCRYLQSLFRLSVPSDV